MAFNPFNAFRKYSKAMFAVLAIICMFTFVLSSGIGGRGDFFAQMGELFGGDSTPAVAQIDGARLHVRDLEDVKRKRRLANEYMSYAVGQAGANIVARFDNRTDLDPLIKAQVDDILNDRRLNYMISQFRSQQMPHQAIPRYVAQLDYPIERAAADKKPELADALKNLQKLLRHDLVRMMRRDGGEMYFGGTIRTGEGLIDFVTWKWVADKRGISLTEDTVRSLIEQETLGELTADDAKKIENAVIGKRNISDKVLMDAFADEFRVWIAQTSVLGVSTARENIPTFATPYELRQDYADKRTAVRVTLLPVVVEDYLAKVTEKPTDADLKTLFEKFKNSEWQPVSETPGFKEPKRVKLEYVSGRATLAAFKKAGQDQAKQDNMATATLPFAVSIPPLGGVAGTIGGMMVAIHKVPDLPFAKFKEEYEKFTARDKIVPWSGEQYFRIHESSVVHAHVYAATVASAFGAYGTGGSPLAPAAALYNQSAVQEIRERARIGVAALAGVGPNLWALAPLPDAAITPPLPLETVRPQLSETINNDLARAAFDREMRKFHEELTKRSKDIKDAKKPEPKKTGAKEPSTKGADPKKTDTKEIDPTKSLQEYVAGFVKKFGLSVGGSKAQLDRYNLVNDVGLKPLADAYFKERKKDDPKGYEFAPQFFSDRQGTGGGTELFAPTWFDNQQRWSSFGPNTFNPVEEEMYVVWKVEETEAKVRTLEQAKVDVELAWKRNKARDLAKSAAEEVSKKFQKRVEEKKLKDLAAIEAELKDFAAEQKLAPVKLDPLPRIALQPPLMPTAGPQYQAGQVNKEQVPDATQDFAQKLTDMRKKPPGETVVLHDQPKARYYVGVLLGADSGSDFDFRQAYGRINLQGNTSEDTLLMLYEMELRVNFRRDLIKQLRTDAKVKVFDDELKKFDDTRSSGDGE